MEKRSWAAAATGALGVLGVLDAGLGPALASAGVLTPMRGFFLFGLGLLASLLALLVGVVALIRTRAGSGRSGRSFAWLGMAAGVLVLATAVMAAAPSRDLPRINDITTNPQDPPQLRAARKHPANADRDLSYPREFGPIQREGYPDLAPIHVVLPPDQALKRVEEAAKELGWQIVEVRADRGELEANQTSGLFQFVDDVAVRVRAAPAGSLVDVRSKSRDGRGDLGANAARIRALAEALGG